MSRRYENDRDLAGVGVVARVPRDLVAVHLGHLHVQEHHRKFLFEQQAERFIAGTGSHELTGHPSQYPFERRQIGFHIVDQEHLGLESAFMLVAPF